VRRERKMRERGGERTREGRGEERTEEEEGGEREEERVGSEDVDGEAAATYLVVRGGTETAANFVPRESILASRDLCKPSQQSRRENRR
jgi:hypothetical protein